MSSMPEVAIAEDDQTRATKDEIRLANQQGIMQAVTKAATPKLAAKQDLSFGITRSVAAFNRRGERGSRLKL